MRHTTPDERGWSRPRPGAGRAIVLALIVTSALGGLFVGTPAAPVHADDLADAVARHKALETRIAQQKARVAALATRQKTLSGELASTKASLRDLNADLTAVRTQVVQATVDVALARGQVEELVPVLSKLDLEQADVEAREAAKLAELDRRKALLGPS